MMKDILNTEDLLGSIHKKIFNTFPNKIYKLPNSGSSRIYYRLLNNGSSTIAVYNDNKEENIAFINFTKQLQNSRINVPEIIFEDLEQNIYFLTDLGDNTLFKWLLEDKKDSPFSNKAITIYKEVIRELIRIQIIAGKSFNYSKCFQHREFNKDSIIFDLNYFKQNFIGSANLNFNNKALLSEFELLARYLLSVDSDFFMFRDFQSRNIMLYNEKTYFIDYQGGRKGALQYDLASLLFQAKAQIPENIKSELLEYYISIAQLFIPINKKEFIEYFYSFALVRVLQTLGAYGLRGLIEKKSHFIESIPFAINNLKELKNKVKILNSLPELNHLIDVIINTELKFEL